MGRHCILVRTNGQNKANNRLIAERQQLPAWKPLAWDDAVEDAAWAGLPQFLSIIYNEILQKILFVNYVFARLPQLLMWQRDTQVMQLLYHANFSYATFWISDGLHAIKGRTVASEILWSKFQLKHPRTCWSPAELTEIFQRRKRLKHLKRWTFSNWRQIQKQRIS